MINLILGKLSSELARVATAVQPSLVRVTNGRHSFGGGTIWDTNGLVLTNAHVAHRRAPEITLWDGRTFSSQLIAKDEALDLALLAIPANGVPTLEVGDSTRIRPGNWVTAVGHPWGIIGAASSGAVIDVGRPLELPRYPGDLIQVGLQLRPGHSGGPLVDEDGRLIGLNTMIAGPQVGLAIPIHVIELFLRRQSGGKSELI